MEMKDLRCYSWTAPHLLEWAIWLIREDTTDMHIFVQTHRHIQQIHKPHRLCNVCLTSRTNKHEQVAGGASPAPISKYFTTLQNSLIFHAALSYDYLHSNRLWRYGINKKGLICIHIGKRGVYSTFLSQYQKVSIKPLPFSLYTFKVVFKIVFQLIIWSTKCENIKNNLLVSCT